jgi:phage shock protein A
METTMGSGNRLFNLWKGFTRLFVSDLEAQNPRIVFENAIRSMVDKHVSLKKAAAQLLKNREKLEQKLNRTDRDLEQIRQQIEIAVSQDNDQVALMLIENEQTLMEEYAEAKKDLDLAAQEAEVAKASLNELAHEIEKIKRERDRTLAQIENSEARKHMQDQLDGISIDDDLQALDNVREYAASVRAEVQINDELKQDSLSGQMAQIQTNVKAQKAQNRLAQLKAQRNQK